MKKLIMYAQIDDKPNEDPTPEEYLIEDDVDGKKYAQDLIDSFNATLRPKESSRTLLRTKEESLGPILTPEEFFDEVNEFKAWANNLPGRLCTLAMDKIEDVYEDMIQTGKTEEFKELVKDSGCTERFQRIVDSPMTDLRQECTIEDLKEKIEKDEERAPNPFDDIHPMGIIKGGLSIGIYADPMSFSSSQRADFIAFEKDVKQGMGDRKYYTTRLQDPAAALKGNFDLVVIDYGGMAIPGMSGMEGFMAKTVRTILEDKPSTMVWLASTFTANSYMDLVAEEYGEEHSNLMITSIQDEKSWIPLHELWKNG